MQDTLFPGANGVFIVDSTSGSTDFTYTATYEWAQGNSGIFDSARTALYSGIHYTGSDIGGTITLGSAAGSMSGAVQVDTSKAHGLEVGNEIAIAGSAGTNVNGSWVVARVSSPTRFFYFPDQAPSGSVSTCLLYTSPSPRDLSTSRMPSSA